VTPDPTDPLAAALAEYLAALEAGAPLDRATFLDAHAHLADDLPDLLDKLEQVQGVRRAAEVVAPQPAEPLGLPNSVGEYRLVREVGRGGMGVVYEAEHAALHRRVAVKVVPTPDPAARDRLLLEARVQSLLVHPHVVPVHAVGEGTGFAYIVLHYVEGQSLNAVLRATTRSAPPPPDEGVALLASGLLNGFGPNDPDGHTPLGFVRRVSRLTAAAADALGFAHDRHILHRDVKPGNLLLDVRGHLWLTDFGLARRVSPDVTVGERAGTTRYMAPELFDAPERRGRVGPEADVYALGATLYELLARRPAFEADSDAELRANIRQYHFTPLTRHAPDVPPDLEKVVHKAMARLPGDRYPNGGAMAADLRRFLAGQPVSARRLSPAQRVWRWGVRRRRPLAAAAGTLVLGLTCAVGVGWWGYEKEAAARREVEDREALLRELLTEVNKSEVVFRHLPQGQAEHRRLVRALKDVVCKWADEPHAKPETKVEAVRACQRLGEAYSNSGDPALKDDTLAAYVEAVDRVTALRRSGPDTPVLRSLDATANKSLAGEYAALGRWSEAKSAGGTAEELYQGLIAEDPARASYRNPLSQLCTTLAHIARVEGRSADRIAWIRKGLAADQQLQQEYPTGHPQSYIRLAGTWESLGEALAAAGVADAAEDAFRNAVTNDEKLRTPEFAYPRTHREYSVGAPLRLAAHLLAVGKRDEAGRVLTAVLPEVEALATEYPDRHSFTTKPPLARHLLGQWHFLCGRPAEAKAQFRKAIESSRQVAGMIIDFRLKFHLEQPFPELVDAATARADIAALEKDAPLADTRWWRLALAVGMTDRDGVDSILASLRRTPPPPEEARHYQSLEALHLARIGDPTAARAALPPTTAEVNGWLAVCRKIVADAK
jgi:serine/threonine protein kinase/tetratricopeptide (TPR) repeat protein